MRLGLAGGAIAIIICRPRSSATARLFTVNQTQQALVVRLGKPVRVITEPGLNVKVPFIDSVIYIDKRILNIESPAQEITLSSQDNSSPGRTGRRAPRGRRLCPLPHHRSAQILSDRGTGRRRRAACDPAQLVAAARAGRRDTLPTSCATSAKN